MFPNLRRQAPKTHSFCCIILIVLLIGGALLTPCCFSWELEELGYFVGLPLLSAAAAFFLDLWIADAFYGISIDKGYTSTRYFWMTALFGPIGFILIAVMPDRGRAVQTDDELPPL